MVWTIIEVEKQDAGAIRLGANISFNFKDFSIW